MASTRTMTLVVIGVLALATAAVVLFGGVDDGGAGTTRGSGTSRTPPGTSAASGRTTPSPAPTPVGTGAATPSTASEILPATGAPASGYHLPPVRTGRPAPLVGPILPLPAVAKGRLVAGFPAALAPPRPARVESSSVAVSDGTLQAALTASGSDARTVLVHYREVLTARGYTEAAVQGVENAPAATFRKGKDSVTVSTVGRRTYVLARVRPVSH
jgi:hypothetical protein